MMPLEQSSIQAHSELHDGNLTALLGQVSAGSVDAADALFDQVYTELHRMAKAAWRSVPPSDTLQPTALVHEMYARLFHEREPSWENRRHFFATAARAMHDIVVEQARRHASQKRGGHLRRIPLTEQVPASLSAQANEVLALDIAIDALAREHPDAARVLRLRVFGGLSHEQVALVSDFAEVTARRRWAFARAWVKLYLDTEMS